MRRVIAFLCLIAGTAGDAHPTLNQFVATCQNAVIDNSSIPLEINVNNDTFGHFLTV